MRRGGEDVVGEVKGVRPNRSVLGKLLSVGFFYCWWALFGNRAAEVLVVLQVVGIIQ